MAQIVYLPKPIPLSTSGTLLAGAKLYTYTTGTSTPQAVYQDYALTTPHANPVEADANGVFPVMYWGNTARYRLTLKTSADVTLSGYPVDDCGPDTASGLGVPSLAANNTYTGAWNKFQSSDSRILLDDSDGSTDKRLIDIDHNAGVTKIRTRTDADGSGKDILAITRGSGTAVSAIVYGNSTDLPTHTFRGALAGTNIAIFDFLSSNDSSSSTTLANSSLSVPLTTLPYSRYCYEAHINISGGAGGISFNMNFDNTFSGGASSNVAGYGVFNSAQTVFTSKTISLNVTTSLYSTATLSSSTPNDYIHIFGSVRPLNDGNLSFAYALNSASGTVTLAAGSWLKAWPMGV